MTLAEALQNTLCDVLRTKLKQFLRSIENNVVVETVCPVCRTDLRSSFQFQANQEKYPGRGTCRVCCLEIQMHHRVEHVGHMLDSNTKQLCQYEITMPVALAHHITTKLLREKWRAMKMPRRPLTTEEKNNWVSEARALVKRYSIN